MFQRPPFLPQTRTVWTPNNNFLVLDQVTMSREEAQPPKCDIRSVVSPYPLVLPYPLPRYTASCEEKGPAVPELQVWKPTQFYFYVGIHFFSHGVHNRCRAQEIVAYGLICSNPKIWFRVMIKAVHPAGPASRDSICSSSTATVRPGPAGFCKFCSIPVCNIQIRDERKCKSRASAVYSPTREAN